MRLKRITKQTQTNQRGKRAAGQIYVSSFAKCYFLMLFSHRSDSENKNTQDSSMKKYQKASMYCSFYKINIFLFVENSNQEI